MKHKLIVRLFIVSVYFVLDIGYTVWKMADQATTDTVIEKSVLFLAVSLSVYLITRKEESPKTSVKT